ncbi:uncharacterized protein G2W53_039435 [Senna tora]|uniref:Uncharacterized protein n=1 Tax=Senna tora TaxID=362788 RepID=A0A834W7Y4_9FABA|nr:uncharacterized protein G2W53_039435 [Senna tora]
MVLKLKEQTTTRLVSKEHELSRFVKALVHA